MDGAVKLFCGCAVVLAVAGERFAHMRAEDRQALLSGVGLVLGGSPPPPPRMAWVRPGPEPKAPPASSLDAVAIPRNRFGQFEAPVEIDGQRVSMMVDTGATLVTLSFEDADRLGIRPLPSDFRDWVNTANGRAAVARVTLREVRVGPIALQNVDALVGSRGALNTSLLGMTFLGRLRSVRVEDGRLALQL